MSQPVLADVLRYVGRFCNASCGDLSDAELLQRFLSDREETAFALLVQRHGPLVLSVCQRLLGDAASAEDAFQATFLVLAQRAASIRKQQSVASWLYGVAQRLACKARAKSAARLKPERRAAKRLPREPLDDLTLQELRTVLDEEMARLPEKNRVPLVLCYFQGKTHEQAAAELGWPTRSLTSRIARGRELLRRQLLRRGIALSAGALATALGNQATGTHVGALLTINTVKAALKAGAAKAAAGGGTLSASAAALAGQLWNGGSALRGQLLLAVLAFGLALGGFGLASYVFVDPQTVPPGANANGHAPGTSTKPVGRQPVDRYGEPLPQGAIARMGTIQFRHPLLNSPGGEFYAGTDPTIPVAFSPDGQVMATSWGKRLRLWNANTGKFLQEIKTADHSAAEQVFSPDGRFLAAALVQSTPETVPEAYVCLWDARTGKLQHRFPPKNGLGTYIWHILFSRDSKLLAIAHKQGTIHLWSTETGKPVAVLSSKSSQNEPIARMAFAPDGKTLVALPYRPREIWHFDIARGEISKVVGHEVGIKNENPGSWWLADDGKTFTGLYAGDRSVPLLDTSTGKVRCQLQGEAVETSHRWAFTPGGRLFATAGYTDGDERKILVSLWDTETGKLKHQFTTPPLLSSWPQSLGNLTFSADGRRVTMGGWYIRMYDVASGNELLSKPAHQGEVPALAFTPDSSTLISGGVDGMVGIWDAATGKSRHFFKANRWMLTSVALIPGGSTFVSGGQDGLIRQYDWRTGKEVRRFGFNPDGKQQFAELRVTGDGKTVIGQVYTAKESKEAPFHSWDLATGKLLRSFPKPGNADFSYLSADGKQVVGVKYRTESRESGTVTVREIASGRLLFTTGETDSPNYRSQLTADGRLLILGTYQEQPRVRLYELVTGKERWRFVSREAGKWPWAEHIAVSPDNRILATANNDHTLQFWDLLTGKELLRHSGFTDAVYTMTFSPNGKFLATSHRYGAILVWEVPQLKRQPAQVPRSAKELDAWYADLAGEDAVKALTAIANLVTAAEQAVGLFKDRLRPAADKSARIAKLIAQLNDARFAARQAASQELQALGGEAEPALRQAVHQKMSLEERRRIEKILDRPAGLVRDPEVLQGIRAIEVLEYIAPPSADATRRAALELLKKLADGAPQARQTQEAQAALRRLETRLP